VDAFTPSGHSDWLSILFSTAEPFLLHQIAFLHHLLERLFKSKCFKVTNKQWAARRRRPPNPGAGILFAKQTTKFFFTACAAGCISTYIHTNLYNGVGVLQKVGGGGVGVKGHISRNFP